MSGGQPGAFRGSKAAGGFGVEFVVEVVAGDRP
jgi:hypothetical protein